MSPGAAASVSRPMRCAALQKRRMASMEASEAITRPGVPNDDAPHLLVVDDDTRIRTLLKQYLGANGFRVSVAGTAAEARRKLEGIDFDLLVLDVMMPGETGV